MHLKSSKNYDGVTVKKFPRKGICWFLIKISPWDIKVPVVAETLKMANKPWLTGTLCFPLSHLLCNALQFFPAPSLPFSLSPSCCLSPQRPSLGLFLFSKQGSLYRKLCILEAFRKAESRFPVGAMATKKKKRREEERKRGGRGGWVKGVQ